ncbi:MAG TPA: inositol monophosphatase family protein [Anaerohalosphaeraceae bacterium]|nr:inositol monophosphatase [Phycisphaerae bacterium]HOK94760.1 inositol monophosphatase family protein [Anaerohalosphaeraceae bacterium]HOL31378.1 inositol monophosphatase family protein [Anaerohalosphaeraceae bacterium]HOM76324.1 inositol monophosphatase family protein [Anaerohalosphaeraceae bacterium]HPC64041.1 inositol monophosphatase family protein [Anaerohalosphaeraceae bacterium]
MKNFLHDMILQAGAVTLAHKARLAEVAVHRKSDKDLVTEADIAVEQFLIEKIKSRWPHHAILGEESGHSAGSEYRWVIDPIDGTTSFFHNLPFYSISIALQRQNQTVLAAVYAPVLGELFIAEKDNGACLNDAPIRVSGRTVLSDCVMATGFACLRANLKDNNLPLINRIAPKLRGLRILGSAALDLCYVACGRLDGSWEINLNLYDIAAGMLIAQEAGAIVSDFSGGSDKIPFQIAAASPAIYPQLQPLLQGP